jgi:hypothetical protein
MPSSEQPVTQGRLSEMPNEILKKVFAELDPVDSICLGIANKQMYGFYEDEYEQKRDLVKLRGG